MCQKVVLPNLSLTSMNSHRSGKMKHTGPLTPHLVSHETALLGSISSIIFPMSRCSCMFWQECWHVWNSSSHKHICHDQLAPSPSCSHWTAIETGNQVSRVLRVMRLIEFRSTGTGWRVIVSPPPGCGISSAHLHWGPALSYPPLRPCSCSGFHLCILSAPYIGPPWLLGSQWLHLGFTPCCDVRIHLLSPLQCPGALSCSELETELVLALQAGIAGAL